MTLSRHAIPALAAGLLLLAGCGGPGPSGKDNPFQPDPEAPAAADPQPDNTSFTEDSDGDGIVNAEEDDGDRDANGIENILQGTLRAVTVSPDGTTVDVEINGIDGTPLNATYARRPSLDIDGALLNTLYGGGFDPTEIYYTAYSTQEDPLDRLFTALGRASPDGSVRGDLVHGHGQFNVFLEGALYLRNGEFDPPDIGAGPGQGQVSYDGIYAGFSNLGSVDGETLLVSGEPVEIRPQEDARVIGQIFLNANFSDNEVNGSIFNRKLVDPADASGASVSNRDLPSIALVLTDVDTSGRFFGEAQISRRQSLPEFAGLGDDGTPIGNYGGAFAGQDAEAVGGITRFEDSDLDPARTGVEIEHGLFVLTQCGRNGDETRCDHVSP